MTLCLSGTGYISEVSAVLDGRGLVFLGGAVAGLRRSLEFPKKSRLLISQSCK